MSGRRPRWLVAALLAFGMTAGACSGGDDDTTRPEEPVGSEGVG